MGLGNFKAEGMQTTIVVQVATKDVAAIGQQIRTHAVGLPKELTELLKIVYRQLGS